jgi:(2Fe-2S) ferredoxin
VNIQPTPLKTNINKDKYQLKTQKIYNQHQLVLIFIYVCFQGSWLYIYRDDSWYLSLFMFFFRGVGCIFTEMIAGTYLYLCFCFQGSWMYIYRDDSWYLSLFMFVFRGVGCIFTEMIAGRYNRLP